jgi:hypothetical protein
VAIYELILVSVDGREVLEHDSGSRVLRGGDKVRIGDRWWRLEGTPLMSKATRTTFVCSPMPVRSRSATSPRPGRSGHAATPAGERAAAG